MTNGTRDLVRDRAGDRCEYCLLRQEYSYLTHHVEHILAKQHGGSEEPANLALACQRCNLRKGPNLTGIDPLTNQVVVLFHPRRDQWQDHFRMSGARIDGTTPMGRATVEVLSMNDAVVWICVAEGGLAQFNPDDQNARGNRAVAEQ